MDEGQEGFLMDDDVVVETSVGHDALTGDWAQDSLFMSRRNGLIQINHGHMGPVDRTLLLSRPLTGDLDEDQWAKVREKAEAERGERFKLITVDLDFKAAYERHKICGLPLVNDDTNEKMKIQDPEETMRRYCRWMRDNKPEGVGRFVYPADQVEAYDMGREGFRLIYDEFSVMEGAERAVDAAQQSIYENKTRQKNKLGSVRSKMSSFEPKKRSRAIPRPQPTAPVLPVPFQAAMQQHARQAAVAAAAPSQGLSTADFLALSGAN
jgi:hypothetical protein